MAGIKHSYDWDHLAAIDNSTRKFVAQRKDPASVGFAFSLGHSSVVILVGVLVVGGAVMVGQFMEDGTTGNLVLGLIGIGVSGIFLLAMGLFNGSAFLRAAKAYRSVQGGKDEDPVSTWLGGIDLGEAGLLLVACLMMVWGVSAVATKAARASPGRAGTGHFGL